MGLVGLGAGKFSGKGSRTCNISKSGKDNLIVRPGHFSFVATERFLTANCCFFQNFFHRFSFFNSTLKPYS
jgi:hypothetical protein